MPLTTGLRHFFELVHVSPMLVNLRLKALNGGLNGGERRGGKREVVHIIWYSEENVIFLRLSLCALTSRV